MKHKNDNDKDTELRRESKTGLDRNKILWLFGVLVIGLMGVYGYMSYEGAMTDSNQQTSQDELTNTYENEEYGFGFSYSDDYEVKERREENRDYEYLNEDVVFFSSLRDIVSDEKPVSIAFFYALPGGTLEQFEQMVNDSDQAGEVTEVEEVTVNELNMNKVVSGTASGIDKTHYLFERNDNLIIISVFLNQEEVFESMLDSWFFVE